RPLRSRRKASRRPEGHTKGAAGRRELARVRATGRFDSNDLVDTSKQWLNLQPAGGIGCSRAVASGGGWASAVTTKDWGAQKRRRATRFAARTRKRPFVITPIAIPVTVAPRRSSKR